MLDAREIVWTGPNISCIDLCKGDTVSEVVYKIATELCSLDRDLNVSDLDYTCILDITQKYKKVDLFLLFSILLHNDCKLRDLITLKLDELDTTELLVNNLDIKCFLQDYLDEKCTVIRFYNQPSQEVNPNNTYIVFQKSAVKTKDIFYVSDVDQSVWEWNGLEYVKNENADLNTNCYCDIESLDLDVPKVLQVIINNICQTRSSGIIEANNTQYKTVFFDTVDPNTVSTIFSGSEQEQLYYYISKITHKIWRWVPDENSYLPSLLTPSNINILDLGDFLTSLELSFLNWVNLYQVYQEPSIISCLNDLPTLFNVHLIEITDTKICDIYNTIGTPKSIWFSSLSKCDNIIYFTGTANGVDMVIDGTPNDNNAIYVNISDEHPWAWNNLLYVPYKVNLAFSENHQWAKLCDIQNRLKNIESTCCTPTCDNTTIGFSSTFNDGVYTLEFNKASGTNIDESFTDCGSTLTATDYKNKQVSVNIELRQDLIFELDLSGLDLTYGININIKSCLSNDIITCKNCYFNTLESVSSCSFCRICAEGNNKDSYVEVIYSLKKDINKNITTQLQAGQCITFVLPDEEPNIKSVYYSDENINLVNDIENPCLTVDIPEPLQETCWFFPLPTTGSPTVSTIEAVGVIPPPPVISLVPIIDINFNLVVTDNTLYDSSFFYNKLHTYLNPQGLALTGVVDGMSVPGSSIEGDNVIWFNRVPTSIEDFGNSVTEVTLCTSDGYRAVWHTFGTNPFPNYFSANGNTKLPFLGGFNNNSGNTTQSIYTMKSQNSLTPKGIILRLKNQPLTAPLPEISLMDHINNNLVYTKGMLLNDDCGCPS